MKTEEKFPELFMAEICADYDARNIRAAIFAATDYAFLDDADILPEEKTALKAYRQHLRDISKQEGFPCDLDWGNYPLPLMPEQDELVED